MANDHGEIWMLASTLLDGPRTREEIEQRYQRLSRQIGFFMEPHARSGRLAEHIDEGTSELLTRGWATRMGDRFHLTDAGREQAEAMMADMRRAGATIRGLTNPMTASVVTLVTHLVLAAVKLPAAIVSGSIGLLNDAIDTLVDGLASLLVYVGVRRNRERAVSVVLAVLMLATAAFTLYEAINRLVSGEAARPDLFAVTAIVLSGGVCTLLWLYQKLVGIRSANMALITQSVDSRNHVLVAVGVVAGLVGSALGAPVVDHLVGLAIAVLIGRSAIELLIELISADPEQPLDLTRHRFAGFERLRRRGMEQWLLHVAADRRFATLAELRDFALDTLSEPTDRMLEALGVGQQTDIEGKVDAAVAALEERQLVAGDPMRLTEKGRAALQSRTRSRREARHCSR